MSANLGPRFVATPKTWVGQVSVANSNRDGTTGTYATILTAGSDGSLVEMIRYQATVTTTQGMLRIFLYDGTNARLFKEIPIDAATGSATVVEFSVEFLPTRPLILPATWQLRASTEKAEVANVFVNGGDY